MYVRQGVETVTLNFASTCFIPKITTRVTKDNIETCQDIKIAMRAILYIKTI